MHAEVSSKIGIGEPAVREARGVQSLRDHGQQLSENSSCRQHKPKRKQQAAGNRQLLVASVIGTTIYLCQMPHAALRGETE
jgi:hypothetical protein